MTLNPKVQGSIPCASTICCVCAPKRDHILWELCRNALSLRHFTPYFTPYLVSVEQTAGPVDGGSNGRSLGHRILCAVLRPPD